jgi:hypothetical protein
MRLRILASFVVGLAILGVLGLRGAIAPEAARLRLEALLGAGFGAPVRLAGTPDVRLLPSPRIVWRDAVLADAATDAPLVAAETVEARLALAPLLRGAVEPTGFVIDRADLAIDRARLLAALRRLDALPGFDLRLKRSTLGLTLAADRLERFDAVEGRIARSATDLAVDLSARWRDETVELAVTVPRTAAASRWRIAATAAGATLQASGGLGPEPPRLGGTVALSIPEPARLAHLLALPAWADLVRAPVTLAADLAAEPTALTLTDLRLALAGSTASGALALTLGEHGPALSGTLAFGDLDLTGAEPIFGEGWRALPLDGRRPNLALDLRLSARRLVTKHVELARPAASLNLADGRLNAEIGDAGLWDRPVSAILVGDFGAGGLLARLRALAKDLPAVEIGRLFAIDGVEAGALTAAFEGETRCVTLGACIGALEGRLRLSATALAVTGTSPFGDVTRFHPIVVAPKSAARRVVWPEADADIGLVGTNATIDAAELRAPDTRFALKGSGDLSSGAVDLAGHAYFRNLRAAATQAANQEIRIPLRIHGTLRRLDITPAMPEQVPVEAPIAPLAPIPLVPPIAVPDR